MTLRDSGITNPKQWAKENNIETVRPLPKHRYFYICGSKKEKKDMLRKLNYPIISEMPKCEKSMYDDGVHISAWIDTDGRFGFKHLDHLKWLVAA